MSTTIQIIYRGTSNVDEIALRVSWLHVPYLLVCVLITTRPFKLFWNILYLALILMGKDKPFMILPSSTLRAPLSSRGTSHAHHCRLGRSQY